MELKLQQNIDPDLDSELVTINTWELVTVLFSWTTLISVDHISVSHAWLRYSETHV